MKMIKRAFVEIALLISSIERRILREVHSYRLSAASIAKALEAEGDFYTINYNDLDLKMEISEL